MTLVITVATRNTGKLAEFSRMFSDWGIQFVSLPAEAPIVVEDGLTFVENARKKAMSACQWTGLPALADDSGLEVFALDGRPGVYSARFAGPKATDQENNDLLLQMLIHVPDEERGAQYVAALAFALPDGRTHITTGYCKGVIVREAEGTGGFGYDPIFMPTGLTCTMANASPADKDAIGHRGGALRAMVPIIKAHSGR